MSNLKIAYIPNTSITANIPKLVLSILRQNCGDSIYDLSLIPLLDQDLASKLSALKGNIKVTGVILGKEEYLASGMPSMHELEILLGSPFTSTIKIATNSRKAITEEIANAIISIGTTDNGFSSMRFQDDQSEDSEIIDIIKKEVCYSREITLLDDEKKDNDAIWKKICDSLNS